MRTVGSSADGDVAGVMQPISGGRLVVRLSANGDVDYATTIPGDLGGSGRVYDVLPLADGRTVLLETTDIDAASRIVVLSAAGVAALPWTVPSPSGRTFLARQVLAGPSGSLILAGPSTDGAGDDRMTALRVSTAGIPDSAFSADGFAVGPVALTTTGGAATLLPGGDLLLGALQAGTVRFAPLGHGRPCGDLRRRRAGLLDRPSGHRRGRRPRRRPDGRFFVVYSRFAGGSIATLVTERRRADGSLDPLYSGDSLGRLGERSRAARQPRRGRRRPGAEGRPLRARRQHQTASRSWWLRRHRRCGADPVRRHRRDGAVVADALIRPRVRRERPLRGGVRRPPGPRHGCDRAAAVPGGDDQRGPQPHRDSRGGWRLRACRCARATRGATSQPPHQRGASPRPWPRCRWPSEGSRWSTADAPTPRRSSPPPASARPPARVR